MQRRDFAQAALVLDFEHTREHRIGASVRRFSTPTHLVHKVNWDCGTSEVDL